MSRAIGADPLLRGVMHRRKLEPMKLVGKIISGGQTGVDIAALYAASECNLPTGGTAPRGYLTEIGPRPALLKLFGLREHHLPSYPPRTLQNIKDSDMTLIVTDSHRLDGGSDLTRRYCFAVHKPVFHATLADFADHQSFMEITEWFEKRLPRKAFTINIAGNRESKSPGIERIAERELIGLFGALLHG